MKKVFDNSQLAHVWAQRTQDEGRTTNKNMFFSGDTIYSYGRHFPVATFIDEKSTGETYVIYNNDSYSVSTTKHQSYVRRAVSHYEIIPVNTRIASVIAEYGHKTPRIESVTAEYGHKTQQNLRNYLKTMLKSYAVEHLENILQNTGYTVAKRRKKSLIQDDINIAVADFKNIEKLLSIFKIKIPVALRRKLEKLQTDTASVTAQFKKQIAQENKERRERQEKYKAVQEKLVAEALPLWRDGLERGHHAAILRNQKKVYLRVKGDNIQTSHSASFPVDHAKKAWPIILTYKRSINPEPKNFYKVIRLGHFHIDKIDNQGNVTAGCHYVEFDEIQRIAKQLKLKGA